MIYKLRKQFILICAISILVVVGIVFAIIFALNVSFINENMDMLADQVSAGGGIFPASFDGKPPADKMPPNDSTSFEFFTSETPFATRHFTVFFDKNGNVEQTFMESIFSIPEGKAIDYAKSAFNRDNDRGWIYNYRYKVFSTDRGYGVVLIDGSMVRSMLMQSIRSVGLVLFGCAALVLIIISLLSGKAIKPIAESYEKQKQFVTDANHELKTPLTLILTNVDIAEEELGQNEWLDDIRAEGHRMSELVNQLVTLSRMDEDGNKLNVSEIALDKLVQSVIEEFEPLAQSAQKTLTSSIDGDITYRGDKELFSRLVGILMDNAIKYCDVDGEIRVTLRRGRKTVLTVENTYAAVGELELHRLFDRFYRADKARKFTGGYGIGLSMAKAIVENHKGQISAYKKDDNHVGFKVIL